jgi:ubiquinone/menaquinone biosynthesis C-methylase UbiE
MSDFETRDLTKKVQQQFGTYAQNYVHSTVHSSSYSLDRLLDLLEVEPGHRALDVATGGGHVALGLAKRGADVIASDITPKMIGAARPFITEQLKKTLVAGDVSYAQLNAQALPYATGSLDRVTCRIAPHHFPNVEQFVREAARVVKRGGIVGVVDQIAPANDRSAAEYLNAFERLRDPSHRWEHDQPDWESFFDLAGLRTIHVEVCCNRLEFGWWVRMQKCPSDVVTRLEVMLRQAPRAVANWLQPELTEPDSPGAMYFSLWQLILIGVKD